MGWGGKVQTVAFQKAGFQVAAAWTHLAKDCDKLSLEHGIAFVTSDYNALLARKDIPIFVISTPPFMHYSMATKALEASKHLICGAPLAVTLTDTKIMNQMAYQMQPRLTLMDLQLRFLPEVQKMRELIKADFCGQIVTVNLRITDSSNNEFMDLSWKNQLLAGGGTLNSYGIHCLDLISFLFSSKIVAVFGNLTVTVKKRVDPETVEMRDVTADDTTYLQIELENGTIATIFISNVVPGIPAHKIEVIGLKGVLELSGCVLTSCKAGESVQRVVSAPQSQHPHPDPWTQGCYLFAKSIFKSLQYGITENDPIRTIAATFEDGLFLQTLCEAIHKSDRERVWVSLGN